VVVLGFLVRRRRRRRGDGTPGAGDPPTGSESGASARPVSEHAGFDETVVDSGRSG
jgi:hypothetical protein